MQWSKIHTIQPQHPGFRSGSASLLHGVPSSVHFEVSYEANMPEITKEFKLYLVPSAPTTVYWLFQDTVELWSLLSVRSSGFWISSNIQSTMFIYIHICAMPPTHGLQCCCGSCVADLSTRWQKRAVLLGNSCVHNKLVTWQLTEYPASHNSVLYRV